MAARNPLGNLFGRSPIGPIQEHMQVANQAAQHLPDLIIASCADNWDKAVEVHKNIADAEKSADKLKRYVRTNLPKSLFLPVPRSDLLTLVGIQDKVANAAKDVAGLIIGRHIRFPEKMHEPMVEFAQACAATSQQAYKAVQELDELLEVGFTGREVKRVEVMLKELGKLEARTDRQGASLRAKLFKVETGLPPIEVMFYYQIISLLGDVADNAESVGDRLQILLAR